MFTSKHCHELSEYFQDFAVSELEGDIFDGRKRKRDGSDGEYDNDEFDEKPSKKKSKKKQKPETSNTPGKYVLLKPQVADEEAMNDEVDAPESAQTRSVRRLLTKPNMHSSNFLLDVEQNRRFVGWNCSSARRNEIQ